MSIARADVAIIGGGLIGCWAALFLRQRNRSVVLLEKGSVGAQSSGVNYGNLRLQGRHPRQYPLALRAHTLWEDLGTLIGDTCEYARGGHLYLALSSEQVARIEVTAAEAIEHGVAVELLGANETRRRWPWLSERAIGACFSARDATANPRLVTPAVARATLRLGATVLEGTRAVAIEAGPGRFRITTDRELSVECEVVVNAAGAWGAEIAARLGEPVPLVSAGPPQFVTEPVPVFIGPSVQAVDGSVILRQVERGNVVVSGFPRGPSDAAANRAPVPPAKTVATMRQLASVVPALRYAHVIRVWSGIEGYLPDMLPVIGPSATTPGVLHAFGCCGHGFQLGPGIGACLAELATEGTTSTPLASFSIARFKSGVATDEKLSMEFDAGLSTRAEMPGLPSGSGIGGCPQPTDADLDCGRDRRRPDHP
jgi:sarcosine oxidase subunit beta